MPMCLEGLCRRDAVKLARDKAAPVEPQVGPGDVCFESYPALSIEDWRNRRNLWIA